MNRYKLKELSLNKLEYGSGAAAIDYDGETRYVRITDIDDNGSLGEDVVSPNSIEEKYLLNDGDVLFARTGATVGKTFRYRKSDGRCIYAGFLIRVVPNQELLRPDYLYFFTKSPQYKRFIQSSMKVVAQPNINAKQYGDLEFNVPDLSEQDKILSNLLKINHIIELRKKELVSFDELIKARFVELFGDPVANPKKWPVKRLKDLSVQINSGNTPKGGSENYVEDGITFFRSQNVWKDRLEMDDIVYIDAETHAGMKRSSLKHGDILMTKTGRINTENSSLGRAALYTGEDDMANVNGHVYFIRLKEEVNNKFVLRILVSPEYRDLIRSVCVGGIDKRQLNKEHIEDFPIICPPEDMVDDYIALVEQIDKSKVVEPDTYQAAA